jgi:hypothetical protein
MIIYTNLNFYKQNYFSTFTKNNDFTFSNESFSNFLIPEEALKDPVLLDTLNEISKESDLLKIQAFCEECQLKNQFYNPTKYNTLLNLPVVSICEPYFVLFFKELKSYIEKELKQESIPKKLQKSLKWEDDFLNYIYGSSIHFLMHYYIKISIKPILRQSFYIMMEKTVINSYYRAGFINDQNNENHVSEKDFTKRDKIIAKCIYNSFISSKILVESHILTHIFKDKDKIFLSLNSELESFFKYPSDAKLIFPMLVEPKPWVFMKLTKNLVYGGYLSNSLKKNYHNLQIQETDQSLSCENLKQIYSLNFQYNDQNPFICLYHSDWSTTILNNVQKTPFNINFDLADNILRNNIKKTNVSIDKDSFKTWYIQHVDSSLSVFENLYKDSQKNSEDTVNKALKRKFYRKYKDFEEYYSQYLSEYYKTLSMFKTMKTLFALNIEKIYFPIVSDFRGRLYLVGYPLNPILDKIFRCLFRLFYNNKKSFDVFNMIKLFLLEQKIDVKDLSLINWKNYLDLNKIEHQNTKIVIESNLKSLDYKQNWLHPNGIDATASGISIIGLIIGDLNILNEVNYIDNFALEPKRDFYSSFNNKVLLELKNINYNVYLKYKDCHRDIYKKVIMKMTYNESIFSRTNFIKESFNSPFEKVFDSTEANLISNQYQKTFESISEDQAQFFNILTEMAILKSRLLDKKFLIQFDDYCHYFEHTYLKNDKYRYVFVHSSFNKSNLSKMKILKPYDFDSVQNPDIKKIKNSIKPNFAHYLESFLLYNTINILQEKNISCFTIHDCFYCLEPDVEEVKKAYFEAGLKIYNRNNLLTYIFNLNFSNINVDPNIIKGKKTIERFELKLKELKNKIIAFDDYIFKKKEKQKIHNPLIMGQFILYP